MTEILNQPSSYFIHTQTGIKYCDIWSFLREGAWKNIIPENIIDNSLIEVEGTASYKPVIEDFYLMQKGMLWDEVAKMPYDPIFVPKKRKVDMNVFLEETFMFFKQFEGRQIGVQVSGGLDSSIIIALLRCFKIPFNLVGLVNDRFEFRTENRIQKILSEWGDKSSLIDHETCLPYFFIEKVPPHQYPEEYIRSFASNFTMAKEAKNIGIEVLFTGQGGDNAFADEIFEDSQKLKWKPHTYFESWVQDLVYTPQGIELIPFFSDENVSELIYNLRLGQKEDIPKLWARNFFKDLLPKELVEYSYHSDFWGLSVSGVEKVTSQLSLLFEQTYDLTKNEHFNKKKVEELLQIDLLNPKKNIYMQIESLLSIAVWIDSLVRGGIIKKW